jgi:large subunit ribosomal protein L18
MKKIVSKNKQRVIRHRRLRSRIVGTGERPRLCVFRSNHSVYVQLIDDAAGKTLAAADSRTQKGDNPMARARAVGTAIAQKAKSLGITAVVFDRGGFRYQGNVAALADGARSAGLTF